MSAKVKMERGAWWLIVHAQGQRTKRRFGVTKADRARAQKAAAEINHRLALGQYEGPGSDREAVPFDGFAGDWLRREIQIPLDRGMEGHVAAGTAQSYSLHVRVHLVPYFQATDVREIQVADVQGFYDRCIDRGKPKSRRTIEFNLATLRLILSHARALGLVESNAVESWKRGRGRRRSSSSTQVNAENVLSFDELQAFLAEARREFPGFYPVLLFLAHTGARFGEMTALRWLDVDLESRTARIRRSHSSGVHLGPTKTGRERTVELSQRLCTALSTIRPDLFLDGTLVFPSETGTFIDPGNFRNRVWARLVRKVLGRDRRFTPHGLRHTFASLHMARGTNLLWVQQQGGWASASVLLGTYAHYLPTELYGYADALSAAPDGTIRHQPQELRQKAAGSVAKKRAPTRTSRVEQGGLELQTRDSLRR